LRKDRGRARGGASGKYRGEQRTENREEEGVCFRHISWVVDYHYCFAKTQKVGNPTGVWIDWRRRKE
jgi:hypothetical protein